MKKISFTIIFILINWAYLQAQDCIVLDTSINKSYEGKCKKGFAHKFGKAQGVDKYEGDFKKGMKHGEGIYTWANGAIFKGAFENDKKHGYGKLIEADSNIITGYWKNDLYVGQQKEYFLGYKIINSTNLPGKPFFRKIEEEGDEIRIEITDINKGLHGFDISNYINADIHSISNSGSRINARLTNVKFPFKATVSYGVPNKSANFVIRASFIFEILEPGVWHISLAHN
ncbi:MAG: hypothetical protein ACOCUV_00665 [bacterium]